MRIYFGVVGLALLVAGCADTDASVPPVERSLSPEAFAQGKKIYRQRCQFCHGEKADGKGPLATEMEEPKPRDFRLPDLAQRPPDALETIVRLGGEAIGKNPMMPPWEDVLSDQEIKDVVVFVQAVSRYGRIPSPDELHAAQAP